MVVFFLQCGHGPKTVENGTGRQPFPPRFSRATRWCFNAATARRPWRTVGWPHAGCYSASMRPRPEDRGEPGLQWGTNLSEGFNAATARRPWRTKRNFLTQSSRLALQCGHGPKTVENSTLLVVVVFIGCFNAATARRPWRTSHYWNHEVPSCASMRPRPEDRGEPRALVRLAASAG